jgi:hypothetical protein
MRNTSLVVIGELMTRGRLEVMNRLKPLITQPTFRLERKYMSTVTMPNRANFLLFSNYSDAARLEEEDRRYFVHIADVKPQPAEYYDNLFRFIHSEDGTAAFAHYLLHRDISHFNPHAKAPMTASKRQVIEESRSPLEAKFYAMFEDKEPPFDKELVTVDKVMSALNPGFSHRFGKELNFKSVSSLLRKIGDKDLGQKRLGKDGSLRLRLWVIRRHEMWQQAGKEAIEKHLEIDAKATLQYFIARS